MDHALQTISYIADIGSVLVIMARRRLTWRLAPQAQGHRLYKMICHVFHSEDVSSWVLGVLGERKTQGSSGPPPTPTWSHCHPNIFPLVLSADCCLPPSHRSRVFRYFT